MKEVFLGLRAFIFFKESLKINSSYVQFYNIEINILGNFLLYLDIDLFFFPAIKSGSYSIDSLISISFVKSFSDS